MKIFFLVMMMVMVLCGVAMAQEATQAQEKAAPAAAIEQAQAPAEDDSFTLATVSGEISGITKKGISIVYDKDYDSGTEYEMMILFNDKTQFKHRKDMSELKVGDLISIEYEKPGEKSKHKTMATIISFVQSGVTSLATEDKQAQASESDVTP